MAWTTHLIALPVLLLNNFSMVNEVVGNGDWDESESLGEIWKGRNAYSYGRKEGGGGTRSGTARPEVLDKLLSTTERVVQEIDSVEYGLTDIQEYYANTGALSKFCYVLRRYGLPV